MGLHEIQIILTWVNLFERKCTFSLPSWSKVSVFGKVFPVFFFWSDLLVPLLWARGKSFFVVKSFVLLRQFTWLTFILYFSARFLRLREALIEILLQSKRHQAGTYWRSTNWSFSIFYLQSHLLFCKSCLTLQFSNFRFCFHGASSASSFPFKFSLDPTQVFCFFFYFHCSFWSINSACISLQLSSVVYFRSIFLNRPFLLTHSLAKVFVGE